MPIEKIRLALQYTAYNSSMAHRPITMLPGFSPDVTPATTTPGFCSNTPHENQEVFFTTALLLSGPAFADSGKAIYEHACITCHGSGIMDSPKLGDKEAWAPRLAQGKAKLLEHADYGFNAMPAHGGNDELSDMDVEAAVDYMINREGADPEKDTKQPWFYPKFKGTQFPRGEDDCMPHTNRSHFF